MLEGWLACPNVPRLHPSAAVCFHSRYIRANFMQHSRITVSSGTHAGISTGVMKHGADASYAGYNPAAAAAAEWAVPMRAVCGQGHNDTHSRLEGGLPAVARASARQLLATVPVACVPVQPLYHPA